MHHASLAIGTTTEFFELYGKVGFAHIPMCPLLKRRLWSYASLACAPISPTYAQERWGGGGVTAHRRA